MRIRRLRDDGQGNLTPMKRMTLLVSVYYYDDEPRTSLEDPNDEELSFMEADDYLFLNDAIEDVMTEYNPDSGIFDVCIDVPKAWLFNNSNWFTRLMFRLIRK